MNKHLTKIKGLGTTPLLSLGISFSDSIPRTALSDWAVERITAPSQTLLERKRRRKHPPVLLRKGVFG